MTRSFAWSVMSMWPLESQVFWTGTVELVGAAAGYAKLPILPNDVSIAVDQQDPVVGAAVGIGAVRRFGLAPGSTGAGHQREPANALRIVGADN